MSNFLYGSGSFSNPQQNVNVRIKSKKRKKKKDFNSKLPKINKQRSIYASPKENGKLRKGPKKRPSHHFEIVRPKHSLKDKDNVSFLNKKEKCVCHVPNRTSQNELKRKKYKMFNLDKNEVRHSNPSSRKEVELNANESNARELKRSRSFSNFMQKYNLPKIKSPRYHSKRNSNLAVNEEERILEEEKEPKTLLSRKKKELMNHSRGLGRSRSFNNLIQARNNMINNNDDNDEEKEKERSRRRRKKKKKIRMKKLQKKMKRREELIINEEKNSLQLRRSRSFSNDMKSILLRKEEFSPKPSPISQKKKEENSEEVPKKIKNGMEGVKTQERQLFRSQSFSTSIGRLKRQKIKISKRRKIKYVSPPEGTRSPCGNSILLNEAPNKMSSLGNSNSRPRRKWVDLGSLDMQRFDD